MKKLLALAVCLMLAGMISVNGTFAFSIDSIFEIVSGLANALNSPQDGGSQLAVDTVFQIRSGNGVKEGSDDYLQPAKTAALSKTDKVTIGGTEYAMWSRSSRATDKIVSVANTASQDAYFRAAFEFRCSEELFAKLRINKNETDYTWETDTSRAYPLLIATYKDTLAAGQTSPPMILQLALEHDTPLKALTQFGMEVAVFAVETNAFEGYTSKGALDAAIPVANIVSSFAADTTED